MTIPDLRARLTLRRLGIDTYREHVIFMHADCHVCRAEGFEIRSRVNVALNGKSIVATLNVVRSGLLTSEEASLSEGAWRELGATEGAVIALSHPEPVASERFLRAKVYGSKLSAEEMNAIIADVAAGIYPDIHLAAFLAACAGDRLDIEETIGLTRAMIKVGGRLSWDGRTVADKHCVGGLPGNRTSMIVVPIIAAAGILIPKTSSRAITSPAGTADTMEVLAPVNLDLKSMREVVDREGGCLVWGGSVQLSPADDILIAVERPLDFDSEGQLVASVLSKKIAAGSTHVVLDLPVGPTAKIRSEAAAAQLANRLQAVADAFGVVVRIVFTDGIQPVGRGIGPALEANDVVSVLRNDDAAPSDLRERSVMLAGQLLELAGQSAAGMGEASALELVRSGAAWSKFQAICEAQGGIREIPMSSHRKSVTANRPGMVTQVDNRRLAKVAKLAGAPRAKAAGVDFETPIGTKVTVGDSLFTIHSETRGELDYALQYVLSQAEIVAISEQ